MKPQTHNRTGIMLLEVIVALGLVTGILTAFAFALSQTTRQSGILFTRQQAMMAAEAAMNDIRDGRPPSQDAFAERFSGMQLTTRTEPADGQWSGFTHVIVTVSATVNGTGSIRVRLDGYVRKVTP